MSWTFKGYKKSHACQSRDREIKSLELDIKLLEQEIRTMFVGVHHAK